MTRTHWLLLTVLVLAVASGVSHWWNGRGLITIHCEDWPAPKVAREIERQGGITLKTNLTDDIKIRMHVDKVPLTEAIETLSTQAEARWRLAYIFATKLPEAHAAAARLAAGDRPEGWKTAFFPMFIPVGEDAGAAPDPRADVWTVKPAEKPEFQEYAGQAARTVNAAFIFPESWNPAVNRPPSSGPIHSAAPALAKAAGGRVLEVFVLEKREREPQTADARPDGEAGPPGDGGPGFFRGRRPQRDPNRPEPTEEEREKMRTAFGERIKAEIDKLPPEQRTAAEERRKFFEGMRDLSPEERRAKIEEFMSSPANQERMEQRMSEHMARMSPDQRVDRAKSYVNHKQAAQNRASGK